MIIIIILLVDNVYRSPGFQFFQPELYWCVIYLNTRVNYLYYINTITYAVLIATHQQKTDLRLAHTRIVTEKRYIMMMIMIMIMTMMVIMMMTMMMTMMTMMTMMMMMMTTTTTTMMMMTIIIIIIFLMTMMVFIK